MIIQSHFKIVLLQFKEEHFPIKNIVSMNLLYNLLLKLLVSKMQILSVMQVILTMFCVVMFPIMLFGILDNLCIITIILKNRLLRLQPTNVFLLNLAISDFLHLCINPILFLSKQHSFASKYYLGGFTCHLTPMVTGKSLLNHRKILILIFHENEIPMPF